jgi:hypothetical protein
VNVSAAESKVTKITMYHIKGSWKSNVEILKRRKTVQGLLREFG